MAVGLALEFTFVNSLLEELFWRVYLYRELGGVPDPKPDPGDPDGEPGSSEQTGLSDGSLLGGAGRLSSGCSSGKLLSDAEMGFLVGGTHPRPTSLGGGASLCGLPPAETPKVLISAYYASYHFVVMVCFVPWYLAIFGFGALVVLGRILVFCREQEVRSRHTIFGSPLGAQRSVVRKERGGEGALLGLFSKK